MKRNLKQFLALLLALAMALPMVSPVVQATAAEIATEAEQQYAYVAEFSDSTEGVEGLPEGWVTHPSFKNGIVTQKDGTLYISTKTTSGVFSAFYEQDAYTDYLIEADFTMLDKTDNNRWMGFTYRANSDDAGTNIFAVKYSNVAVFHSYYTTAITGYDGTTASKSWNTFKQTTFSSSNFPELVNAPQTTVNLKLKVVGENLTAYVNNVVVLETTIHNSTQEAGSFGISTAMANIKVENFKVTDLSEPDVEETVPAETSDSDEEDDQTIYAYEAKFSESTEEVEELPEGWVRHPSFKNGTIIQKEGALYFNTKDASGVCAAFYEQDEYTDYLIEADFTMLDKTDNNRWMGFAYRTNSGESAINTFDVKYSNVAIIQSYYGSAVTGYDGSTLSKGWKTFTQTTFSSTNFPELVNAPQTTVNLKLSVVGNQLTAYVNDVMVLETTTHNTTQELGSFGIVTANANIKVENFRVVDLTEKAPEKDIYAYEAQFSDSAEEIEETPEGWVRHPSYKNGTLTQKEGALYFNALTASGVCVAYYDQNMYTDYLIEADFTMVERSDDNRWMGFTYRANSDDSGTNMFVVKYNNVTTFHSYYGSAVTGYDGSVLSRGWTSSSNSYFPQTKFSTSNYPELVNAAQGTVNLKLAVIGNQLIGFVNNVKVLETEIHNATQELGSFGIATANTNTKVENFRVIDLSELNQESVGDEVAHGLVLPTSGAVDMQSDAELDNYVASSALSFDATAADTAVADILIAKSGTTKLFVTVQKNGTVTISKKTASATETLFEGTAEIADPTSFVVKTTYANGVVKVTADGADVGYGCALGYMPGAYGFASNGSAILVDAQLNETVTCVSSVSFVSNISKIEYNTTPDWNQIEFSCTLSDGSVIQPEITSNMITGFDPTVSGMQNLTLTYEHAGRTYTEKFTVQVSDDPANIPNAKIGIISDVHIGAYASNPVAMEKALNYYKSLNVDAIVCVGDMGHDKMEYLDTFNDIYESVFPDGEDAPEKFFVMGNHDTYAFENAGYPRSTEEHNNAVEAYFTETFGCTADGGCAGLNYYKIINGYVFIGLYIQTPIEERAALLDEAFALPEAQGKPVFVVNHEIPVGSVYIAKPTTATTSEEELHEYLTNYPNAVVLTGHFHNPLADERAIWQGEYTNVSCGALFGPMVEENMYEGGSNKGSFQPGNWDAKAALYMEIKDSGINIVRYDFTHDGKLGKDWYIPINDGQIDRTPYNYALRTEAAVAPEFAADAKVTAEALSESMIRVTFPKAITVYAEMDDIIQSYIIRAYDDDTNELLAEKRVISQHYLGRDLDHDTYTLTYTGLNSATNYRFEVVAVESYQKESQPLVVKADTKAYATDGLTSTFYANFDYEWDALEFDMYDHNGANPITITDGMIRASATNSSKAIIKDLTFSSGTVETLISMNNSGANINAGIYLFASAPADEQDTITAYNVHIDSSAGSKDLRIALYKFTGKYDSYLSLVTLTDYFTDGINKASVNLKVEVSSGVLSVFIDGSCVMTYTVGTMSGGVGLRSHYAGSDFDYIRVHETSTGHEAPDSTNLEALFLEAKELLAVTEVEGTDSFTGENLYVTQETYDALTKLVETYDLELIRAYERHVVQVESILADGIEQFKLGIEDPSKKWMAMVGNSRYESVSEAITAANGGVVTLLESADEEIVVSADVTIDLAGCDLSNVTVADGVTLTLIDTATDDYEGEYGSATVTGTVVTFAEVDGKTYLAVFEDGVYSSHCYDVVISHISLNPRKDALGYKAQVCGDEVVQAHVKNIGFNLWVDGGQTKTYEKAASNVTLRLQNILKCRGGEMNIHATAFVTLVVEEDNSSKTSIQQTTTMRKTLQMVDKAWNTYTDVQKTAVKTLCDQYYDSICKWGLNNIYPAEQHVESYEAVSGSVFSTTLNGFAIQNGQLLPAGGTGEGKVILTESVEGDKFVSVDIYPVSGNLINSGIYLGASNAASAQDSINALTVIVESTVADNPNRVDIVIGNFPNWEQYHRTVIEGNAALFTNGVKEPVNLKVDVSGNNLTVTLALISNPSKSVTVTYTYTGAYDLSAGLVGLRSQYDDSAFDNFKVTNSQQNVEYTFDNAADVTGLEYYHSSWVGGIITTAEQTLALHSTATFTNGTFAADLNTNGDKAAGIVFGADASGKNYYLYRLTANHFAELVRVENGIETVVDRAYHNASTDVFKHVEVVKDGSTIYCYYYSRYDKVNCYAVYEDPAPLSGNRIGIWSEKTGVVFQNITTSNNISARKADVLIFGHSYTEMWWDYETYFPEYSSIDNIGIGGSVASQWEALADEVVAYEPKLGIYNIGINDLTGYVAPGVVIDSVENALLDVKKALPNFEVVLVSVSHCPARSAFAAEISETNALMRNLAASYDWIYYAEAEYLFCTDPSNPYSTDSGLFIDGLHPSAEGYQLMADVIRSAINGENQPEYDETLGKEMFETTKRNMIASMGIYTRQAYTIENWVKAEPYYDAAMEKINACTTDKELRALDLSGEIAALNAIPNKSVDVIANIMNAQTRDALNADSWTKTNDNTVNANGYSYVLDNTSVNGDMEVVFHISNNTATVGTGGIFLRAKQKDNDGIEGYLVNYVSSGNYMQVYYVNNAYNTDGSSYVQTYLGGIAYGSYGDIIGTDFYVKIEEDKLYLSTLERYQAGQDPLLTVDLTFNGVYEVFESGYFGILSWNANTSFDMTLKHFVGNVKTSASVASVGSIYFDTVADAVAAANGGVVKMLSDSDEVITISSNAILDLNGCTLTNVTVTDGFSLKLIDSATEDCTGTFGSAVVAGQVDDLPEVDGKSYLLKCDNNVYSAHYFDVSITDISLATEKNGLRYTATLTGDDFVQSKVTALGLNLWVDGEQPTEHEVTGLGEITVCLENVMSNAGGETDIHAVAVIIWDDNGTECAKESAQYTTSMKQVVEKINNSWNRFNKEQKTAVQEYVNKFADAMATWNVERIVNWAAEDNVLKILTVGNSFSVDSMEYFYQIAQDLGVENIVLGDLYIGACSLDTHYANLKSGKAAYIYYTNYTGTWTTVNNHTMQAAIESEEWDYICFQHSNIGWDPNSYAILNDLIDSIAVFCPDAKFVWNMYWAYPENSTHHAFPNYGGTQESMYNIILDRTQELVATNEKISIVIPTGTAIQNARSSFLGDTLTRDNCHLNDIGKYIAGITWVEAITGIDTSNLQYHPDIITEDIMAVALESVQNAMENPYELTPSQYPQASEQE